VNPRYWRDAIRDSELDRTAKLIAYTLSTWMNGQAEAFPGKDALADRAGVDVRTVDRALHRIEAAGFVRVRVGGGRARTNRYEGITPAEAPGFLLPAEEGNPGTGAGLSAPETPARLTENPGRGGRKPRHPCPPKASESEKQGRSASSAPASSEANDPGLERLEPGSVLEGLGLRQPGTRLDEILPPPSRKGSS
jgi:hypothetical protein